MAEPKIRFKRDDGSSYPEWQEVALGDIATRVTRKNSKGETDRPLTIASIEGLVDQRTYFGKTVASKDMSDYFLLKNGEYAYNKSYSVGYDYGSIKRLDKYDMGALSTLYICFALNNNQNTDFYNCYFNGLSWYNQMGEICAEGARNHGLLNVSASDFFKIRLSVPSSSEEQQRIAEFLSSVDEVIVASEQEVANLETQKKAVMKKIFSQEVRFKREDGTGFPEWEEIKLGSFAKRVTRKNKDNACKLPLTISAEHGLIDQGEFFNKTVASKDMSTYYLLQNGEFAFNKSTSKDYPVGAIKRLDRYDVGAVSPLYICFELFGDAVLSDFVVQYFETDCWHQGVLDIAQEGARTHGLLNISVSGFFETVHELPSDVEEQRLIAGFLSNFDEAISATKKKLELWKELKKGLLQQMFV